MYLGLKDSELATIKEIAEQYDISKNHLMKVVYELNRMGYIETIRGKNGGMRLHRPPADVNLAELVRRTESDLALVECFGDSNECRITAACELKHVLKDAMDAFFRVLEQYTLEDLLRPRRELAGLLSVQAIPADEIRPRQSG
jgi:Rrf2 family nitric oxide-sensitive transcriptional repressor